MPERRGVECGEGDGGGRVEELRRTEGERLDGGHAGRAGLQRLRDGLRPRLRGTLMLKMYRIKTLDPGFYFQ